MAINENINNNNDRVNEYKPLLRVGVVGSGSFGTAIIKMLVENSESIEQRGHNPNYLTAINFNPEKLRLTTDINELVSACDVVILATPSIYLGRTLENMTCDYSGKIFISAIKGIVPEGDVIVAHYIRNRFGIGFRNQGVIAGPCHAEEVAMERLSYLTIATAEEEICEQLSQLFSSHFIKVSCSRDILGNEYSASGLGYGDNFTAVFVSNAIREMKHFLDNIYEAPRDVNESAYLGDLLVTAYSLFSRNRNLGNLIGKGYTVKSAIQSMNMIAEGYYATKSIYETSKKKGMKTPIIDAIYEILYEEGNAEKIYKELTKKLN